MKRLSNIPTVQAPEVTGIDLECLPDDDGEGAR